MAKKAAAKAKPKKSPLKGKAAEEVEELEAAEEAEEHDDGEPADVEQQKPAKKAKKASKKSEDGPVAKKKKSDATNDGPDGKWLELRDKHGQMKPHKYNMRGDFPAQQPLDHPKLGWGFVLSSGNNRIEVVFESGTKILITNYNG